MPFVNAKCTNCGGILEVDDAKEAWICSFCGSPFIVEKSINNYNVTNNISAINANVANFYGSAVKDFDIRGGVLLRYNGVSMKPVIPESVVKIGERAFSETMIEQITIPKSVREIGAYAFEKTALTQVTILEGLQYIYGYAFVNCKKLTSVKFPTSIKTIGFSAFENCSELSSIDIPAISNCRLSECAFAYCKELKNVTLSENVSYVFKDESDDLKLSTFYKTPFLKPKIKARRQRFDYLQRCCKDKICPECRNALSWFDKKCKDRDCKFYGKHPFFGPEFSQMMKWYYDEDEM